MSERGQAAPDALQEQMRALIKSIGIVAASKRIGISKESLGSLASGGSVHAGTISLVREFVAKKGAAR